jgi:hypothetical protein
MSNSHEHFLAELIAAEIGKVRASRIVGSIEIDPALAGRDSGKVTRAQFAMALNLILFDDLLRRVPSAALYVANRARAGQSILLDHGALRTIDGPSGALPSGHVAFARILEPLGYRCTGTYPLVALRMTGRGYTHQDLPDSIPQFFVSELHVSRFSARFGEAAANVFGGTTDPIGPAERQALDGLARDGVVGKAVAIAALPGIARAFGRHHPTPTLADYEALRAESAEAAWIATEGNAFNHATDRVVDVAAVADDERRKGQTVKDAVEISASGRVRQTALVADPVKRLFRLDDGQSTTRTVPGSFFEFISRDIDPATGRLDLRFDSSNAQGIFAMTDAA